MEKESLKQEWEENNQRMIQQMQMICDEACQVEIMQQMYLTKSQEWKIPYTIYYTEIKDIREIAQILKEKLEQLQRQELEQQEMLQNQLEIVKQIAPLIEKMESQKLKQIKQKEENIFLKNIYDAFAQIRYDIHRKVIRQEKEKIQNHRMWRKIADFITGKMSIQRAMLYQLIKIELTMEESMANRNADVYWEKKYEIADIISQIDICKENYQTNIEFMKECQKLQILEQQLKEFYSVEDCKIQEFKHKKQNNLLPVKSNHKTGKLEKIELEAKEFLRKNEYMVVNHRTDSIELEMPNHSLETSIIYHINTVLDYISNSCGKPACVCIPIEDQKE